MAELEELLGYAPAHVQKLIARLGWDELKPWGELLESVAMFADISGFTRLATQLAPKGPEGAEELTRVLNEFYGRLVELIQMHGGDIVRFAGDAVLAIWPKGERELVHEVRRAACCGLAIQHEIGRFPTPHDLDLTIRVNIASGTLGVSLVGGVDSAWQLLAFGEPLHELRLADQQAGPGDVVLAPSALQELGTEATGIPLAEGCFRLRAFPQDEPVALELPRLSASESDALKSLVPTTVRARLDAGQADWMAELREVTVGFLQLTGLSDQPDQLLPEMQELMQLLQESLKRFAGALIQLMVDDKGIVGIVCFGVPPYSHRDNALRAIRSADLIQTKLHARGWAASIGIGSGTVFCGPLGSARRRDYTVIGEKVNLAARLMQHAAGGVLCDKATRNAAAAAEAEFTELPPFEFKGFSEPLPIFRVQPNVQEETFAHDLPGRSSELNLLSAATKRLSHKGGLLIIVEGEAGIGKSALVRELCRFARAEGHLLLQGACDEIERSTPYFPWRPILNRLFAEDEQQDLPARRTAALQMLGSDFAEHAGLLNTILPLEFPVSPLVEQLSPRARAENLQEMVARVLQKAAEKKPFVLLLEDIHWFDSASWRLFVHVARRVTPMLTVATTRNSAKKLAHDGDLEDLPYLMRLTLENLARDAVESVVHQQLGVPADDQLTDYVFQRSGGNPFFVEELVDYLRESRCLAVRKGVCGLRPEKLTSDGAVPATIRALITNRIDQLNPATQLTLKTASAIGRLFPFNVIRHIYPIERDRSALHDHLSELNRLQFSRVEQRDPELVFAFRHVTIQQVTYQQLPIAQRTQLHGAIANWYESQPGPLDRQFPLLAHHWGQARRADKEIAYLASSGAQALNSDANQEAIRWLDKALQRYDESSPEDSSQERRALWVRQMGEAYYKLGDLGQSRSKLELCLQLLGQTTPHSGWRLWFELCKQVLAQTAHRILPARSRVRDQSSLENVALADARLAQIHYFRSEIGQGTQRAMRSLNMSEQINHLTNLARSFANLTIVCSLVRRHRLAAMYARLAENTAERSENLPTTAYVLNVTNMHWLGIGNWRKVREGATRCVAISQQLVDRRLQAESLTVVAMLDCFLGRYEESLGSFAQVAEIGLRSDNQLHQAWGQSGRGECLLRLGRLEQAIEALEAARQLLESVETRTEQSRVLGLLSLAYHRRGDLQMARDVAAVQVSLLAEASHTTASTLEGTASVVEVAFDAWESNRSQDDRRWATKTLQALGSYARLYKIGRPRYLRWKGVAHSLEGRKRAARRCWQASLAQALRHELLLEQAHAHYELGRHAQNEVRQDHLSGAVRLFESLSMPWEAGRARQLLELPE